MVSPCVGVVAPTPTPENKPNHDRCEGVGLLTAINEQSSRKMRYCRTYLSRRGRDDSKGAGLSAKCETAPSALSLAACCHRGGGQSAMPLPRLVPKAVILGLRFDHPATNNSPAFPLQSTDPPRPSLLLTSFDLSIVLYHLAVRIFFIPGTSIEALPLDLSWTFSTVPSPGRPLSIRGRFCRRPTPRNCAQPRASRR